MLKMLLGWTFVIPGNRSQTRIMWKADQDSEYHKMEEVVKKGGYVTIPSGGEV